ncbi:MAG: hypothetical protein AAF196_07720 [Planctomycetota bacterium]
MSWRFRVDDQSSLYLILAGVVEPERLAPRPTLFAGFLCAEGPPILGELHPKPVGLDDLLRLS